MLAKLKALGIENNTIVMYSTDNGAELFNWPDGGTTMFRGEKNTQWEGGFRVPTLMRWPGVLKPGTTINDLGAHEDMIPTLLAAAGDTTVKEDLLKGRTIGDMTYRVHLDGYNLLPFFKGEVKESPRHEFIYWTDGGSVAALRYDNWKISFLRQNSVGIKVWETPFEELRWPLPPTFAWIRSSAPRMSPSVTRYGPVNACSRWRPPVPSSASGCRVSENSRRV